MSQEVLGYPRYQPDKEPSALHQNGATSDILSDGFLSNLLLSSKKQLSESNSEQNLFSFADVMSLSRVAVNLLASKLDIDKHTHYYSAAHLLSMALDFLDGWHAKKYGGGKHGDIVDAVSDHLAVQPALRTAAKRGIIPDYYADIFAVRDFSIDIDRAFTRLTDEEKGKKNVVRMNRDKDESKSAADKIGDALFLVEKTAVGVFTPHSPFLTEVAANMAVAESLKRGAQYYKNSDMGEHLKQLGGKFLSLFRRDYSNRKLD